MSASRLAIKLHAPVARIGKILNEERAVTPDSALRLARYFGGDAQTWRASRDAIRRGDGPGNQPRLTLAGQSLADFQEGELIGAGHQPRGGRGVGGAVATRRLLCVAGR